MVGSRPITLAAHQVHMIRNHSLDPGQQKGSSIEEPDGFAAGPMFAALTFSMSDTMSKKNKQTKKNMETVGPVIDRSFTGRLAL